MTKVLTDQQNYTDIANAIRNKNGTTTTYKPNQMASAINAINNQATLNAPIISLSDSTLTLTNPTTNGNFATGFNIYNGTTLLSTQLIDVTTLDLSTILTENGTYTITAKCYGTNMAESSASSSVSYVVAPPAPVGTYLTFESEDNLAFTLKTNNTSKNWDGTLEYSTDTKLWNTWTGSLINSSNKGKLYLRGTNNTYITNGGSSNYNFVFGGSSTKIQCNGNIENLLDCTTVANGQHPTMTYGCYSYIFYKCTSLTTAPELPATTLATECYNAMFWGCTSLTTPPELPATTLENNCYDGMFRDCTSLTTAPILPATTLTEYCYRVMFYGCTSLTTTPELPATTLASYCYASMFNKCESLTIPPELPVTTLAEYCYSNMFKGCTSLTTAPELPATTLAEYCYEYMFYGCISLTTPPELPATTLAIQCYIGMFYGCTSLKVSSTQTSEYQYAWRIPTSGTGTTALSWNYNMLTNTGGTFKSNPSINTTYYTTNQPV